MVTSLLAIVPLKFCWLILNIILDGVAEESDESSNANTCESTPILNNLADVPSPPSSPWRATDNDIVLASCVLELTAVSITEPLNGVVAPVIVTGLVPLVVIWADDVTLNV